MIRIFMSECPTSNLDDADGSIKEDVDLLEGDKTERIGKTKAEGLELIGYFYL